MTFVKGLPLYKNHSLFQPLRGSYLEGSKDEVAVSRVLYTQVILCGFLLYATFRTQSLIHSHTVNITPPLTDPSLFEKGEGDNHGASDAMSLIYLLQKQREVAIPVNICKLERIALQVQ